jgi:hypothetical protein
VGGVDGAVAVDVHDQAVAFAAVLGGRQYAVEGVAAVADRDPPLVHVVGVLPQHHPDETHGHDEERDDGPHGDAEATPSQPDLWTHES